MTEPIVTLQVPSLAGSVSIPLKPSVPLFVLGRNGVGKSALVQTFVAQTNGTAIFIPGSRPNYFDNEALSLSPSTRFNLGQNLRHWNTDADVRWKPIGGTSRAERAIFDLQSAEHQFKIDAANQIKVEGASSEAIKRLQENQSPLDRINTIFRQAGLPVSLLSSAGEIKAQKGSATYSFARLSDGERAALVLGAEVIVAKERSIFILDEPELHLHRSIVVPMLSALISERPDCGFIVATHELVLAAETTPSAAVLVREANWTGPNVTSWSIDVVGTLDDIPESLRVEIYGARKKLLFVEGTSSSLDQPIYTLLFPTCSIASRDSCRAVVNAVTVLSQNTAIHHTEAFGLVDNDGMGRERISELRQENVFSLPVYSVEGLYYDRSILEAVAIRQANTLGESADNLLRDARAAALQALTRTGAATHLAAKRCHSQVREKLLSALPTLNELKTNPSREIECLIESPLAAEEDILKGLIEAEDIYAVIARYPIRESGMLGAMAQALKFINRTDYEKAALAIIGGNPELASGLKAQFGDLVALL